MVPGPAGFTVSVDCGKRRAIATALQDSYNQDPAGYEDLDARGFGMNHAGL